MSERSLEPIPRQELAKNDGYGDFLEVLRGVQDSLKKHYPQLPVLDIDRIQFFPKHGFGDFITQRDQASVHPFYRKFLERMDIKPQHDNDDGFDDYETRIALFATSLLDFLIEKDERLSYPIIGLHLIDSSINLAPQNIVLDSDEAQMRAATALALYMHQIEGATKQEVLEAISIIGKQRCKVLIYGGSFQIWVHDQIFSREIGSQNNDALKRFLAQPVRRDYIQALSGEYSLSQPYKNALLKIADNFPEPRSKTKHRDILKLIGPWGFTNRQQIAQGWMTSEIGKKFFESFFKPLS